MIETLLCLLAVHAICDSPLQPGVLSAAKRKGGVPGFPWPVALGAHALIHAGGVALVTGSLWLGAAEFFAHALIDHAKTRGWLSLVQDQGLHVGCKIVWVIVLAGGAPL
jgi:hypothetical protein